MNPDWGKEGKRETHRLERQEARDAVRRGIADIEAGRVYHLGSFAEYAKEEDV